MDRKQLLEWMDKVEQRLTRLEVQGDSTPGAPDLPMEDKAPHDQIRGDVTWHNVGLAYRERYLKAKTGEVLDYPISKDRTVWEDVAHLLEGYVGPRESLRDALDGFFADKWVQAHSYPPSALLKGFERFRRPPVVEAKDEPDPEAINARRLRDRKVQEQAELMRTLNEAEEQAAPPPESLEAMVARIGRQLK